MKPFRYAADPLAGLAMLAYGVNRWLIKPHAGPGFLHDHFNDLWLIPAALPLVLWLQRRLGWRPDDAPPTWSEIALHLTVWAVICEGIGPLLVAHATADWRDVAAYLVGALVAGTWWNRDQLALRRSVPRRPRSVDPA